MHPNTFEDQGLTPNKVKYEDPSDPETDTLHNTIMLQNLTPQEISSIENKNFRNGIISSIIFGFNMFLVGYALCMLTSIQPDLTFVYGYSEQQIIWTSSTGLITSIILSTFNSIFIEWMSMKTVSYIVCIPLLLFSLGNLCLPISIYLVYFGYFFHGLATCFVLNSMVKFCNMWFCSKRRPFYFGFLGLSTLTGTALAPFFPFMFLSNKIQSYGMVLLELYRKGFFGDNYLVYMNCEGICLRFTYFNVIIGIYVQY